MADDEPENPPDDDESGEQQQPSPLDNAASPKAQRKRRLGKKLLERETADFWSGVLSTEIGRREIWRLLNDGHAFDERFACGPNGFPQPEATWFQAGESSFARRLYLTLARIDRAATLRMHDENDHRFVKK